MKKTLTPLIVLASLLASANVDAQTYNLIGQRYLRLYTAAEATQSYNAEVDAQTVANSLCNVPWTKAAAKDAETTSHVNDQLDANVRNRDRFDAALFCAEHTNGMHRAYANAAVYRYRLPEGSLPHLTRLTANVSSDPYNALGARIVLYTNSTGEIPMDCATCRGEVTGGIKLAGVAPRVTRKVDGKDYWYPNTTNAVFTQSVQLQKYLFVFVLMENYASSRGNWLEGCSYMKNLVSIETDAAVPGWADGSTVNLMEIDTGTGDDSLDDLMAYYETTQTVVTATHLASGRIQQFTAPAIAYRKISVGSTNLTSVTHAVLPYGDIFVRSTNAVLSSGWRATAVLGGQRVAVIHADVLADRGFESYPPTKPFTQFDRTFVGLPSGSPDTDGDGIADGWELYVGADPTDRLDGMYDWDNDGLTLAEEFDHGYWPTDPRNGMSFGDCLLDFHVYRYHLKGGDAENDFDGDGLPNFAEYLITEIFREATLDPDNPKSDGICVDYFRKMGDTYFGEIFTDHDMIPWEWEQKYFSAANPSVFDPSRDDDLDGWPNFDEYMAGTDPTTTDCPMPEIRMRVLYNAKSAFRPPVIVKAWNEAEDPGANYMPDAIWTLTNDFYRSRGWVTLPKQDGGTSSLGHLRKGNTTFIVYAASSGSSYTPGAPLGVVRGVDVGWKSAKFQAELTSTSPISDRIDIGTNADDRDLTISESLAHLINRRTIDYHYTNSTQSAEFWRDRLENRVQPVTVADGKKSRIRVVRYGIDDVFCYMAGVYDSGYGTGYDQRVVMEKEFDMEGRDFLSEADFLDATHFDIDWGMMTGEIVYENGNPVGTSTTGPLGFGLHVTNMTYLVVVGDGAKDFAPTDTSTTVRVAGVISRRFELTRHVPKIVSPSFRAYVHGARPTFRWAIPDEEEWAARFGSSYTAFRIQILKSNTIVYDSGIRRAPAQTDKGVFEWTADAFAGDQLPVSNYTWKVSMYNAKFRSDAWSLHGSFSIATGTQQETDDHNYSSIDVSVKYTGPALVLNRAGFVRVQAFETADFSGTPVAQTRITDTASVMDTGDIRKNGTLVGLPFGTYFVRAYIDTNNNGVKDDWESWGGTKEPVTLTTYQPAPIDGLYIEDADTDHDLMPDAWEYAKFGDLSIKVADIDPEGHVALKTTTYNEIAVGIANFSKFLSGASLTFFQNTGNVFLAYGISQTTEKTIPELRATIASNIVERVNQ